MSTNEDNLVSVDTSNSVKTLGIRSDKSDKNNGGAFCGDDTAKNLM